MRREGRERKEKNGKEKKEGKAWSCLMMEDQPKYELFLF